MRHWFQRQRKICLVFKKHASDRASSYLYNASFQVFLVMPLLWLDQMTIPPLKNANKMEKIIRACLIKVFSRKKIMFTYTSVYITFVRKNAFGKNAHILSLQCQKIEMKK